MNRLRYLFGMLVLLFVVVLIFSSVPWWVYCFLGVFLGAFLLIVKKDPPSRKVVEASLEYVPMLGLSLLGPMLSNVLERSRGEQIVVIVWSILYLGVLYAIQRKIGFPADSDRCKPEYNGGVTVCPEEPMTAFSRRKDRRLKGLAIISGLFFAIFIAAVLGDHLGSIIFLGCFFIYQSYILRYRLSRSEWKYFSFWVSCMIVIRIEHLLESPWKILVSLGALAGLAVAIRAIKRQAKEVDGSLIKE